jgi:hypothetical protein
VFLDGEKYISWQRREKNCTNWTSSFLLLPPPSLFNLEISHFSKMPNLKFKNLVKEYEKIYPAPLVRIKSSSIKITCPAAPFQVEARDIDGNDIYIRSRHGMWRLERNGAVVLNGSDEPMSMEELVFIAKGQIEIVD